MYCVNRLTKQLQTNPYPSSISGDPVDPMVGVPLSCSLWRPRLCSCMVLAYDRKFWIAVLRLDALALVLVPDNELFEPLSNDSCAWWAWDASYCRLLSLSSHRSTGKRAFVEALLIRDLSWTLDESASLIAFLNCFRRYGVLDDELAVYQNPGCTPTQVRKISYTGGWRQARKHEQFGLGHQCWSQWLKPLSFQPEWHLRH